MKHLKKYLALLLAGLLVASTLAACDGSDSSDGDDDDDEAVTTTADKQETTTAGTETDDPNTTTEAPATTTTEAPGTTSKAPETSGTPVTEMLSPSALFAKLKSESKSTVTIVSETDLMTVTTTTRRSGDAVREYSDYDGFTSDSYYDLGENLYYFYDSDEELWYVSEGDGETWEDLVDYMGFESSLDDDCFEEKDGGWVITDEALQDMKEEEEMDGELTVTYTLEDGVYTYTMAVEGDSLFGDMTASFAISFDDVVVELPEDATPYVEPDYSDSEYANLNPSELYDALINADQLSILVSGDETYTQYDKDGDLVMVYSGEDILSGTTVYIDFASLTAYGEDENGEWVPVEFEEYDSWVDMLAAMTITADNPLFSDAAYDAFDDSDESLSVKSTLLGSDFESITLDRDGVNYYLTESYTDGSYYLTLFSFEEVTVELP